MFVQHAWITSELNHSTVKNRVQSRKNLMCPKVDGGFTFIHLLLQYQIELSQLGFELIVHYLDANHYFYYEV